MKPAYAYKKTFWIGLIAGLHLMVICGCELCPPPPITEGCAEAEGEAPQEGQPALEGQSPQEGAVEGIIEGAEEGPIEGTNEGGTEGDPLGCPGDCTYEILQVLPHDTEAFTQGLQFADGIFYEGTGYWKKSSVRKVVPDTGFVMQSVAPPDSFQGETFTQVFGEGIVLVGNTIIQLTWQNQVAFVYEKDSLNVVKVFRYPTEGWGLTSDGTRLIMSDGTATLYFRDPQTFEQIGCVTVRDQGTPVTRLNELEYVEGLVYANIWQSNRIAKIRPDSGEITGWIDLTGLLPPEEQRKADVLNGIAYDAEGKRLFVTGKYWPKVFEIRLLPKP